MLGISLKRVQFSLSGVLFSPAFMNLLSANEPINHAGTRGGANKPDTCINAYEARHAAIGPAPANAESVNAGHFDFRHTA